MRILNRTCCFYFLSILVVIIAILMSYSYVKSVEQFLPYPNSAELEEEGMVYFKRPSDGRNMEFMDINPSGSHAVVFAHGSTVTGSICRTYEKEAEMFGVRLICPTIPGYGCTEPYEFIKDTPRMLSTFGDDVVSLVSDHLKISGFYIVGVSMGSEFAFSISGSTLKKYRREKRPFLLGLSSVVGVVFPCEEFAPFYETSGFLQKFFGRITTNEVLSRFLTYFFIKPMLEGRLGDPVELNEETAKMDPREKKIASEEMKRSIRHTLLGVLVSMTDWITYKGMKNPVPDYYGLLQEELEKKELGKLVVHIWPGKNDTLSDPTNQNFLLDKIPFAELKEFEGGHAQFVMKDILKELI